MKKISTLVISLVLFATAASAGRFHGTAQGGVQEVYTVVLRPGVARAPRVNRPDLPSVASVADDLTKRFGGRVEEVWEDALQGFVVRIPEPLARILALDPRVLAVEQDFAISAPVGDCYYGVDWANTRPLPSNVVSPQSLTCGDPDPLHDTGPGNPACKDNWGLDRIDQRPNVRDQNYFFDRTGRDSITTVHVYVMDTGVRASHDELKDSSGSTRVIGGADARNSPVNDGPTADISDCYGHGTHVAGIIAGRTYGVAKDAILHPVRIFSCGNLPNFTFKTNVIRGLNWIVGHASYPAVINWSGGNSTDTVNDTGVQNAVQGVLSAGIILVQAAGNHSPEYDPTIPGLLRDACAQSFGGLFPDVIVAGGMDEGNGRWVRHPASDSDDAQYCPPDCGSNVGACIDIWAPASHIISSSKDGDNLACRLSGTSMAAPHVAGVAALYLQDHPGATSAQVNAALRNSATPGVLQSSTLSPHWIGYSDNLLLYSRQQEPPHAELTVSCNGRSCAANGSASTGGITDYEWTWDDGQVTHTTTASTSHNYTVNGSYGVILKVTDAIGQWGVAGPNYVSAVDNNPIARLTVTCIGRSCTANGSASTDDFGITDYEWIWGDGQVAHTTTASKSHDYTVNGNYGVILKVIDKAGQQGTQGPVSIAAVDNPPVARLTVTCSGLYCEANGNTSTDDFAGFTYGFSWTGGTPGFFSSSPQRTNTYTSPGTYTVLLTVRDSIGQTNTATLSISVRGTTAADTVAVDKAQNEFKLRLYHEAGSGAFLKVVITSITGDPIAGDWNGDRVTSTGRYVNSTATFYLRNTNSNGTADLSFGFGAPGADWKPIAGDWNNDGIDTAGLYDPVTQTFYLRNSNSSGSANITLSFTGASSSWLPIAGDWNGDGVDTVGLYDPATSTFYLRNSNTSGGADLAFVFGPPGSLLPNAGDWNGDGWDSIGVFDPVTGVHSLRNMNNAGAPDHQFTFSTNSGNRPVAGDWDGV